VLSCPLLLLQTALDPEPTRHPGVAGGEVCGDLQLVRGGPGGGPEDIREPQGEYGWNGSVVGTFWLLYLSCFSEVSLVFSEKLFKG